MLAPSSSPDLKGAGDSGYYVQENYNHPLAMRHQPAEGVGVARKDVLKVWRRE